MRPGAILGVPTDVGRARPEGAPDVPSARDPMADLAAPIIKKDPTGAALYAARAYRTGDVVLDFADVEWRPKRDRHTVEDPCGMHFYHPVLAMVSHSCEPNCRIVLTGRVLVAARAIAIGEAITYDYETTEGWFSHPFRCLCGSPRCRNRIG